MTLNKEQKFLKKKKSQALSLRVAGQLCSLSFTSLSSNTARNFKVVNNLQPVIKILRQIYKAKFIKILPLY